MVSISNPCMMPFMGKPSSLQIFWVTRWLSPVIIFTSTPIVASSLITSSASCFGGSRNATNPLSERFCSSSGVNLSCKETFFIAMANTRKPSSLRLAYCFMAFSNSTLSSLHTLIISSGAPLQMSS